MHAHTVHFIVKSFNMNQYKIGGGTKNSAYKNDKVLISVSC